MKNITELPITKETFDKWKAAWNNTDPIPENISRYVIALINKSSADRTLALDKLLCK